MCRSIKRLRQPQGQHPPHDEIVEAARQYVRKVAGIRHPSQRTADAFDTAVDDIAQATARLLQRLPPLKRTTTT